MPEHPQLRSDSLRKSDLTPARRRLVELIQKICFGHLERLTIRRGQPVFDPPPYVVRTFKIGGRNQGHPLASGGDFVLKREVVELLELLGQIGDGSITRIEVAHGLPVLVQITGAAVA